MSVIEKPAKVAVLEDLAERWNQAGITYAVMHGLRDYPARLGRDLDVLVAKRDLGRAFEIAAAFLDGAGFRVVAPPFVWGGRWLFALGDSASIEIDFITELLWGPVTLVREPYPSTSRGAFKVDAWAGFAKRVLIQVLGGHRPKEPWLTPEEEDVVRDRCEVLIGRELTRRLLGALRAGRAEEVAGLRSKLRRVAVARALVRDPALALASLVRRAWRDTASYLVKGRPIVAVVGPDGVGKSTVISRVARTLPEFFCGVAVRHWRPGLLPPLGSLQPGRRLSDRSFLGSAPRREPGPLHSVRLLYYWIDYLLGHFLKDRAALNRLRVVLYDRCALDMAVDPVRYGLTSSRGTALVWRFTPKPDLVILLDDHPDRIHRRKPELPEAEIRRQLATWRTLAERGEVDAVVHVNGDPDEIAERVRSLVLEAFTARHAYGPKAGGEVEGLQGTTSTTGGPEWAKLVFTDGRAFAIPLAAPRAAARALDLYNPQRLGARVMKRLLAPGLRLGAGALLPRTSRPLADAGLAPDQDDLALLEHLKTVLQRDDLHFGISLGTPGPDRKPVIQAVAPDGTVLGYAKVGWNPVTNRLVEREAQTLRWLEGMACVSFRSPSVLYADRWNCGAICISKPLPAEGRRVAASLTITHIRVQRELARLSLRWRPFCESRFWQALRERIREIGQPYYRDVAERAAEVLESRLHGEALAFHTSHGDFAPWNMRFARGQMLLLDWEHSEPEAPVAYDLIHFLVQTRMLLRKDPPGPLSSMLQRREGEAASVVKHVVDVGMGAESLESLVLIYALERLTSYDSENHSSIRASRYFGGLINLLLPSCAGSARQL